ARINDVLLTALALAIQKWLEQRGRDHQQPVFVDVEGHGREDIFSAVDLSRTVGWFTHVYPVCLNAAPGGWQQPGRALKVVKEQLRQVPDNGLGFGLLRYLRPESSAELS